MSKLREIIEGHINELKDKVNLLDVKSEEIFKIRENICNSCPLKNGNSCNSRAYINPKTMEVIDTPATGYVKGCGCRLSAKQKSPTSECPAGFWGGEFSKN